MAIKTIAPTTVELIISTIEDVVEDLVVSPLEPVQMEMVVVTRVDTVKDEDV